MKCTIRINVLERCSFVRSFILSPLAWLGIEFGGKQITTQHVTPICFFSKTLTNQPNGQTKWPMATSTRFEMAKIHYRVLLDSRGSFNQTNSNPIPLDLCLGSNGSQSVGVLRVYLNCSYPPLPFTSIQADMEHSRHGTK